MDENKLGSAATGGELGTDDTTLIERVDLSSFVAARDCLHVHFSRSEITVCLGDTWWRSQNR